MARTREAEASDGERCLKERDGEGLVGEAQLDAVTAALCGAVAVAVGVGVRGCHGVALRVGGAVGVPVVNVCALLQTQPHVFVQGATV